MADNMCGPSNGLKGISRHFDANRSEQRDRITSTHPGHAFSQTEHARQDEEFARFQQDTTLLGGPTPINSTHGYVPPQYITPNPNTHPMLVPMPAPPTIPNTMSNAGAQGLNMANVNQYRESPHAFMNSTNSLTLARPGPPVHVGPSSRPPTTNYPLNHHPAPGIMRGSTQFGYRPMPNPMAGPIPFNSQPSSLYHQQPQAANATSATDDFDFDAELSAWMERNSLQDQPNTSKEPQESAHNSSEGQAHVSKGKAVDTEATATNLTNDSGQQGQNVDRHDEDRTIPKEQPKYHGTLDEVARAQANYDIQLEEHRVESLEHAIRTGTKSGPPMFGADTEPFDLLKADVFHRYYISRDLIEDNTESLSPEVAKRLLEEQSTILHERLTRINLKRLEDTELASAAKGVLNAVSTEDSEKFKSSRFLDMMRKVAAMDLVVRGNDLVNPEAADSAEGDPASKSTGEARP
ncbi:hypothetical protein K449DRAFT_395009 [Hypoxylon sp. EC38]|nr:hypothetical protein K449DRAFT_395009 [Hypoxylon sp. EC38]